MIEKFCLGFCSHLELFSVFLRKCLIILSLCLLFFDSVFFFYIYDSIILTFLSFRLKDLDEEFKEEEITEVSVVTCHHYIIVQSDHYARDVPLPLGTVQPTLL